jgi:hypothetical protein
LSLPAYEQSMSDGPADTTEQATVGGPAWSASRRAVAWLARQNTFAVVGVLVAVGLVAARVPVLAPYAWVCFLAGGLLPLVLATVSTDDDGYEADVSNATRGRFLVSQLVWAVTPWGLLTQALQIGGTALAYLRHGGRVPGRDREPTTTLVPPFGGEWTTVNGGVTKATSHSWGIVAQRYAYDFLVTDDEGATHSGDGSDLTDYYAFGQPIRAPAAGTVVRVTDGFRDHPHPGTGWLEWRTWRIAGNCVTIEHADGEYSLCAHLKQGSVQVSAGDHVERGAVVGACGNSGFSTEPHLHYQLQDHPNFWLAAGLVPQFTGLEIRRDDDRRAGHAVYGALTEPSSRKRDDAWYLWAGDRVVATDTGETHAPTESDESPVPRDASVAVGDP